MLPRAFVSFVFAFLCVQSVSAQPKIDWPVFRGDSLQTGVSAAVLPDALEVCWTFKAKNTIEGGPVIVDKTVLVGTSNGKLYALDAATGQKKWDYQTAGILGSPAVRDGAVYVGDVKGVFHCIDALKGQKRWTVAADAEIQSSANFAGDKIVFGSYDFHLYCVSTAGKVLWTHRTKEKIRSTPAIVGDRVLVGGCDENLHVVDLANGREVAKMPMGGHIAASVAVRGDQAYVGNMANQFVAVDWKKAAVLWRFEAKRNAQPFFGSAAVTDVLVVAGSRDKTVRAFERATGKEKWTFTTRGRVDSSPVIAGKRVIAASLDGNLYVLDLASGVERARFEVGAVGGSPAIASDRIIIATILGDVICLSARK